MTVPTIHPEHLSLTERIARDVEAFKASGGQVEYFEPGRCNFDTLTNRQKFNPQVNQADRQAQKVKEGKASRPNQPKVERKAQKVAKPDPQPQPKRSAKQKAARKVRKATATPLQRLLASPLSAAVLAAVRSGLTTSSEVATATGQDRGCVSVRLARLKEAGLLTSTGRSAHARWRPVAASAQGDH